MPAVVKEALKANRDLLKNVMDQVEADALAVTNYKLARKEAFLKMDDLLNSYRLAQTESPGKREILTRIQRISLLIHTQLSLVLSLGAFLKRCPDYHWGDYRVKADMEGALKEVDLLIGGKDQNGSEKGEEEHTRYNELTSRRREIDQLLLENSPRYVPKVHDLFWVESAFELMETTHKLRKMMQLTANSIAAN